MKYYPIFLNLSGKRCLVIGGGEVATRKVETLLRSGAKVGIIARELSESLREKVMEGTVQHLNPEYSAQYLQGMDLILVATNDKELNQQAAQDARKEGIWCNIADRPELCDFILPSLITRGDLLVAISTSGSSPALARKLREDLESFLVVEYDPFLNLLRKIRIRLFKEGRSPAENQKLLEALVYSPILNWIRQGNLERIETHLKEVLGPAYTLDSLGWTPEPTSSNACYLL